MSGKGGPDLLYLDSSAIVKLVVSEPESMALFSLLETGGPPVSSALAKVEVQRAVNRLQLSPAVERRAIEVLDRISLINVDEAILRQAAGLQPVELRSLDAIHLATALSLQEHLGTFLVYDRRLAGAAGNLGLQVASPK